MPRKAKPTPGESCDAHLNDLRRQHGHPPADAKPHESERFAGTMLLAVMRRAYEQRASYCSTAAAWLEPGWPCFDCGEPVSTQRIQALQRISEGQRRRWLKSDLACVVCANKREITEKARPRG
jgi:hypothetical protein